MVGLYIVVITDSVIRVWSVREFNAPELRAMA